MFGDEVVCDRTFFNWGAYSAVTACIALCLHNANHNEIELCLALIRLNCFRSMLNDRIGRFLAFGDHPSF